MKSIEWYECRIKVMIILLVEEKFEKVTREIKKKTTDKS